MDNNLLELSKNVFKTFDKKKIIIVVGFVGILLILLSDVMPKMTSEKTKSTNIDYSAYISDLEKQTTNIVGSISGVGKCKVMITLEETDENVYAMDTQENFSDSSNSTKSEYIFYEKDNDDTPVLLKQFFPKVKGVVVVCQGGDDYFIKEEIISAISSLFGVSTNNITVSKLNGWLYERIRK